ncbi:AhpC/TSA antioxidant enzyme-domain-containing protein [Xylogone sp. PMI_703]|nr:AhpC/TSA antioxidant enzyme-domain-containing protein [Xylogone sp. PMI_703]
MSVSREHPGSRCTDDSSCGLPNAGDTEFVGDVDTNNDIPTQEMLREIEDLVVLDHEGRSIPFKDLYSGLGATRRVLMIFIRHFFCGNCQEFLRTLSTSISPSSLLSLPTPTSIVIIGCGSPSLIPMYIDETSCPYPIYTDPSQKLYDALGMLRTLNLGHRPEYQRRGTMAGVWESVVQGLKVIKAGMALAPGDMHQVGGELLFEPLEREQKRQDDRITNDNNEEEDSSYDDEVEEKVVTWCHRMKNTRDHAELPELREVLGLDGYGIPGNNEKRWERAILVRKGTGLSMASRKM